MNENLQKKVERAIKLIQSAGKMAKEHGQPLEVCYSGGKDSDVILELTKMAGVEYRAIYKNTTIDPPGTIKHALERGAEMIRPKESFIELMEKKGWPSRMVRFCCADLKEYKVLDYAVLGIRADESAKRKERYKEPEVCRVFSKKEKVRQYLPILDWTTDDIAEFAKERKLKFHSLYYDESGIFHPERRLGCLCCPLANKRDRIEQFRKYPNFVKIYLRGGGSVQVSSLLGKTSKLFQEYLRLVCMFSLLRFHSGVSGAFRSEPVQWRHRLQGVSGELF